MDYVEQAKQEIAKWESEKPGFLNQATNFLLWPAEKAAGALIPDTVLEAVGRAVETCLSGLASLTNLTFNAAAIVEKVSIRTRDLGGNLCHRLQATDEGAAEIWTYHVGYAIAEGGITGVGGLAGLAADIPALFAILVRELQEIATCYGFDVTVDREREYLLHVLQAGFAANVKVKMGFVVSLKEIEQILINVAWKKMAEDLASKQLTKHSMLAALRQFAKTLGYQLTKRKALQLVPIVGALVGASLNGALANDIGKAAYMSYRRRWIAEHRGEDGSTGTNERAGQF